MQLCHGDKLKFSIFDQVSPRLRCQLSVLRVACFGGMRLVGLYSCHSQMGFGSERVKGLVGHSLAWRLAQDEAIAHD